MRVYFFPRTGINLGELVLVNIAVRIHLHDLIIGWSSQHLDDFHELVDITVRAEDGLKSQHFHKDAASRPHIYLRRVTGACED